MAGEVSIRALAGSEIGDAVDDLAWRREF